MQIPPKEPCLAEFADFMRAYQDMVFSTAARLSNNDAEAEDIAQEVFMRAYQHFADLAHSPTAGGWLKTVTTHLSLNYLTRYRRRWHAFPDTETAHPADAEQTERAADPLLMHLSADQRCKLIDDALRRLPDHQRLPLVLYHFEELSYEQIAATMHISISKLKTDLHRARAALLLMLDRSELDP